jgi:uncharacterized membrane protein
MKSFIKRIEENKIASAIGQVESNATAEVRVHVEKHCPMDIMDRASEVFAELNMHRTRYRNGVLIYIAYQDHKFAIIGDAGINAKVGPGFWQHERELLRSHFKRGGFTEGICLAIESIGSELQKHFPHEPDDINELPDDISYGDQ